MSRRPPPPPRITTTVTFACPLCLPSATGRPTMLTATFDAEGNLRTVTGPCAHAHAYGLLTQPEAEAAALESAAIRAAMMALDAARAARTPEAQAAYQDGVVDGRSGQDHRRTYPWALEQHYVAGLDAGRLEPRP